MKSFLFSLLLFLVAPLCMGQITDFDSLEMKFGKVLCDTLPSLADSVFSALKTKKFDRVAYYAPTAELIKAEMDTLDVEVLQRMSMVKYQYIHKRLRKQHIVLVKTAKYFHCSLRNMVLVTKRVDQKEKDGHKYGVVTLYVREGKDEFYITFAAIELQNRWFIADRLKIIEVHPSIDIKERIPRRRR